MKKILSLFLVFALSSCGELQNIASQLPQSPTLTDSEISSGLKQALQFGIDREVTKLAEENGFYKNDLVRITLPPELQKVDKTLRDVGLDALADKGLMVLNHAAEDAVKEAIPVFTNAVTEMSINDARNILFGPDNAATSYLQTKTSSELYTRFNPIISNSLDKVGATQVWKNIIDRYNAIPLTNKVNPDLPDYVTNEALDGVFTMIAIEEKDIRTDLSARSTQLLKRVFGAQD